MCQALTVSSAEDAAMRKKTFVLPLRKPELVLWTIIVNVVTVPDFEEVQKWFWTTERMKW